MKEYINKADVVAEIKNRRDSFYSLSKSCEKGTPAKAGFYAQAQTLEGILSFLDTLEVKEVDLEKELTYEDYKRFFEKYPDLSNDWGFNETWLCAKYFFELGLSVNNPITAADRGTAEEIIVNLKRVERDYHIDLTKEIEWLRNQVKKENSMTKQEI